MKMTKGIRGLLAERFKLPADASDEKARELMFAKFASGELQAAEIQAADQSKTTNDAGSMDEPHNPRKESTMSTPTNPTSTKAFGGDNGGPTVKAPSERYSDTRHVGKHFQSGREVLDWDGNTVKLPSQRDKAKLGAYFKWMGKRAGMTIEIDEHTKSLIDEMFAKDEWCGMVGKDVHERGITPSRAKTLIGDNSGGNAFAINPYFVDEMVVTYPLLYSQLVPYCDLVDVPRAASVHGAVIGNPTVTWGTGEGNSQPLYDNSSMVSGLDTNIHDVQCAMTIGRFLLADSMVVNLGATIFDLMGKAQLKSLDYTVANGDGTTQPQGLLNASGVTAVPSALGPNGQITIGDLESLMFNLPLQYRLPEYSPAWVCSDATYHRVRAIPIGSDDARRVFGMDEGSYTIFNWPVRIQQDIPANVLSFAAMKRYRLYRRVGTEFRFSDQGQALMLANEVLLTCIGRYGGRVVDPNGVVVMTDLPVNG